MSIMRCIYGLVASSLLASPALALGGGVHTLSPEDVLRIGKEAYVYGYPIVTMEMTRRVTTNVEEPTGTRAPMGQFANLRSYPDASFTDITAPNADTLYSAAWLDLSREPYVMSLPAMGERFFLFPLLDAWTNVFASPGQRTGGGDARDYLLTGPGWQGKVPAGMQEIKVPTSLVWIIGRTYSTGTPEDFVAVHALQDQYKLVPLSAWGTSYVPPRGSVDPSVDMTTPVRDQVNALDAESFFALLAEVMEKNPPAAADAPLLARLAKIGLVPGQQFNAQALSTAQLQALAQVPAAARSEIHAHAPNAGLQVNGWTFSLETGSYGTDYLQRAYIAYYGLGANLPEDAVYPTTEVDADGHPLSGGHEYVLHFPSGGLPPVHAFWSLTLYNDQFFFFDNPLDRYTLSPRDDLVFNADGSLDLYIQHDSPGADKESNWLPAPRDHFVLMLRFYWPGAALLDQSWQVPAVRKVASGGQPQ